MKLLKNALLVASQRNDFLEGDLCMSSYVGYLTMGIVENNASGQTKFSEDLGIAFTDNELVNLITVLKTGRDYYDDDSREDSFMLDISPINNHRKIIANFNPTDENYDKNMQIRQIWFWAKDKKHFGRVASGL